MASIKERKGKGQIPSYLITVSLGRDQEGKKIFETTTYHPKAKTPAKARKEAEEFAVLFEKQVRDGSAFVDGSRIRFQDFVQFWDEQWLSVRVSSSDMTQRCREDYISTLRRYALPSIGHMKLTEIKSVHLDSIVNGMIGDGKSPKTIRNTFNVFRAIFDYAYRKGLIMENPCARCNPLPKIKTGSELHVFTEDKVNRFLFDALTREYKVSYPDRERKPVEGSQLKDPIKVKGYTETVHVPLQFRVFFTLAVYGGFRRGELCALTWEDIDFENRTIRIDQAITMSKSGEEVKDPKTESGKRTIKLPQLCFDLLSEWMIEERSLCLRLGTAWEAYRGREFEKNYVFIQMDSGRRMNVQTPSAKFRKILKAYNAAVEEEKQLPLIRLHDLRHTNASHLIAHGTDFETVAKRLGHSKASFTLDVYGHALETMDDKASDTLEEVFSQGN